MAVAVETLRRSSRPTQPEEVILRLPTNQAERKTPRPRAHELNLIVSAITSVTPEQRKLLCEKLSQADRLALYTRGDFVALSSIAGLDFDSYCPALFEQSTQEAGIALIPVATRRRRSDGTLCTVTTLPAVDTKRAQTIWLADKRLQPFLKKEVAEKLAQPTDIKPSKISNALHLFQRYKETNSAGDRRAAMATVDPASYTSLRDEGCITTITKVARDNGWRCGSSRLRHFITAIDSANNADADQTNTIDYTAIPVGKYRCYYIPTRQILAVIEIFKTAPSLDQYKVDAANPQAEGPSAHSNETRRQRIARMFERATDEEKEEALKSPRPLRRANGATVTDSNGVIFESRTGPTRIKPNGLAAAARMPQRKNGTDLGPAPALPATSAPVEERLPPAPTVGVTPEVIVRAQAGDHEAFEAIFNEYQSKIYNFIYRMMGNEEDALDLTQDTFLKAYRGIPHTHPGLYIGPWLYRIATNVCLDELNHRKLIKWQLWEQFISIFHPSQIARDDPERDALDRENREEVQFILDRLHPKYRMVLILREYQDLSYDEIAEVLQTTNAAVKNLLFRAREEFRQVYARVERKPRLPGRSVA